jgi:3-oxoadipate enol-lactonase
MWSAFTLVWRAGWLKRRVRWFIALPLGAAALISVAPAQEAPPPTETSVSQTAITGPASLAYQALQQQRVSTDLGELLVRHNLNSVHRLAGAPAMASATTLVLWPSIFSDSSIHEALLPLLPKHWRLVLIDGPGHGGSSLLRDSFTMADCAAAMKQVLDQLNVQRAVIGGTSWGGLVGGEFALLYPEATQGLIMMNTPVFVADIGPSLGEHLIVWAARPMLSWDVYINGVMRGFFSEQTLAARPFAIEAFVQHLKNAKPAPLAAAVKAVLIERTALAPRMPQIQAPTLMLAGTDDTMYPIERQQQAATTLPNGQFVAVPTRHISAVDQPARVADAIVAFVGSLQ